jgi:glycosyltransferase involved in cell wall biosynthesis
MKKYLPKNIKQFLWFIFKSPQRHWIGYKSLFTDLRAYLSVWFKGKEYNRLSVCVGVKNRSHNLIHHLIYSLNHCEFRPLIELVVYDCGSSDTDNLKQAILDVWKGKFTYVREEQPFARSIAFNKAVELATTEYIMVCDADMRVPYNIVELVSRYSTKHAAWFPVVWYTNADGSGRYYTESTGMMACLRAHYIKVGGYDESIREWGKEDWLLFFEFYKNKIGCIRSREPEFIHQYHESLKPKDFVPLF